MNPFVFALRRPVTTLTLVGALISGGVFGLNEMRADSDTPQESHSWWPGGLRLAQRGQAMTSPRAVPQASQKRAVSRLAC